MEMAVFLGIASYLQRRRMCSHATLLNDSVARVKISRPVECLLAHPERSGDSASGRSSRWVSAHSRGLAGEACGLRLETLLEDCPVDGRTGKSQWLKEPLRRLFCAEDKDRGGVQVAFRP